MVYKMDKDFAKLRIVQGQWSFQEPKLEVPTIKSGFSRPIRPAKLN
jgi:hypothetical protein